MLGPAVPPDVLEKIGFHWPLPTPGAAAPGRHSSAPPRGRVRVAGEIWNAQCAEGAAVGETVKVTSVEGLLLEIEPTGEPPL